MKKKLLNILVSAGATREPLDPVRFISNYSTGFLGCEIAREAKRRGHRVILINAAVSSTKPLGVRSVNVQTAGQLQDELNARFNWCDCLVMAAAVCDFRPQEPAGKKIKRGKRKKLTLKLKQNPDILKGLAKRKGSRLVAGFALETENLKKNAQDKLREKKLDLIVATQIKTSSCPFGETRIDVLLIDRKGHIQRVKKTTKTALARILLDTIEKIVLT